MKATTVSPEEMDALIVRYAELRPRVQLDAEATGLPLGALQMLAADVNYTYMSPKMGSNSVASSYASLCGGDAGNGIVLTMAKAEPGRGPGLHMHANTVENFFIVKGRFSVQWGDEGEHEVILEQYDMISIPPGVIRRFENVTDETAILFVILQGDLQQFNDVLHVPSTGQKIADEYGQDTLEQLESMGRKFTAGV